MLRDMQRASHRLVGLRRGAIAMSRRGGPDFLGLPRGRAPLVVYLAAIEFVGRTASAADGTPTPGSS